MTTWADTFATYADACRYYGADTPEDIAAEMAERSKEEEGWWMDGMEAWSPLMAKPALWTDDGGPF